MHLKNKIEKEYNVPVYTLTFDVSIQMEVEQALQSLPSEWNSIDVLVNILFPAINWFVVKSTKLEVFTEDGDVQEITPDPLVYNTWPEVPSVFGKVIVPVVNLPLVLTLVTFVSPNWMVLLVPTTALAPIAVVLLKLFAETLVL